MFIHGGYWRALDHRIFSFLARPWIARGVHVAMIGYDLAPALSVRAIVDEARASLRFLRERAGSLGVDTRRVIIGGHSAGAQLGAMSLSADPEWHAVGFMGVSGVYDLRAVAGNDRESGHPPECRRRGRAEPDSPAARGWDALHLCASAKRETDGFRAQTHAFAAELRRRGCDASSIEAPGRNHFDVLDDLADEDHSLFRRAYDLLGL